MAVPKCSACKGSGKCATCKGTGSWKKKDSHPSLNLIRESGEVDCPTCGQSGNCTTCGGMGIRFIK